MNLMTQPLFGHDDEYMIFLTWCCDSVKHISHAYMVDVLKIYVDLHIILVLYPSWCGLTMQPVHDFLYMESF
jgi:hypothetical protein